MSKANDVVLKIQHGHPGFSDHQIIGTPETIRALATDILSALDSSHGKTGRIKTIPCTLANNTTERVSVSFQSATETEIDEYHKRWIDPELRKTVGCLYQIVVFCLAVYAVYKLTMN